MSKAARGDDLARVVRGLPAELIVDTSRRREAGIRISLPPRRKRPRTPIAVRTADDFEADADAYRVPLGPIAAARLAERTTRRYGDGWALPPAAASPDDPLRSLEYVVVDVETTGGAFSSGHRITEVAAIRLDGKGSQIAEFTTLVNPRRPIPPVISSLTKITHQMVADAPYFEEIAQQLREVLAGAVFVAHNASFDWRFLAAELARADGLPLRGRVLCTVRLARRVVPEVSYRSLDALQYFFDVENEARHRAWGDARATARIFRRLLDRVDEREIACWGDLESLLARRAGRRRRTAMPSPVLDA